MALAASLSPMSSAGLGIASAQSSAIVGAPDEDAQIADGLILTNAGAAYIYEQQPDGEWNKMHKMMASDQEADDLFGWSVATEGGYAIIGAPHEDHDASGGSRLTSAGSAYIFKRAAYGSWTEQQKIVASDRARHLQFGSSVSISEDFLIIGASKKMENSGSLASESTSGAAYIFERAANGEWKEIQKIEADDDQPENGFGYLVSISGNQAIVGVRGRQSGESGENEFSAAEAIYIYERGSDGLWVETQKIRNPKQTFKALEKLF